MMTVCMIQQGFGKARAGKNSLVNKSAVHETEAWLPSQASSLAWSHPTSLTLLNSCRSFSFFIHIAETVNIKFQMLGWLNRVFEDPGDYKSTLFLRCI